MDGPTAFLFALAGAHLVAWLVLGASWRAAFLSPLGVLVPGCALILTHATMFENFMALPDLFVVVGAFQLLLLISLLCVRVAIAAVRSDRTVKPGKPVQRAKKVKTTYLIREIDARGEPLSEWRVAKPAPGSAQQRPAARRPSPQRPSPQRLSPQRPTPPRGIPQKSPAGP